ncbi:hypothetical protein RND71_019194 [Anisodus tanguticus]|uniref:Uncharacterized protein n=1 Tax=Anisodus tanguticus TaxID=243964 RepID=A0AAE1S030_9SOLA|nr:hypothetical protein RND71_019194 [Anisodus tanguticus]
MDRRNANLKKSAESQFYGQNLRTVQWTDKLGNSPYFLRSDCTVHRKKCTDTQIGPSILAVTDFVSLLNDFKAIKSW